LRNPVAGVAYALVRAAPTLVSSLRMIYEAIQVLSASAPHYQKSEMFYFTTTSEV
jgi:hypothetical protein